MDNPQEPGAGSLPPWARALWGFAQSTDCALLVLRGAPPDARVVWANEAAARLWRIGARQLAGQPLDTLVAGPASPEGVDTSRVLQLVRPDGAQVQARGQGSPTPGDPWWVLQLQEADHQLLATQLEISRQRLAALATHSPVPTVLSEVGARLGYANPAMQTLAGREASQLLGTGWLQCFPDLAQSQLLGAVQGALEGRPSQCLVDLQRPDGHVRRVRVRLSPSVSADLGAGFVGTVEDLTEELDRRQRLQWLAEHDPLTGLANREHMLAEVRRAMEHDQPLALLFVDLDDFKLVNDSFGHQAGDQLLGQVAQRLAQAVRDGDLVSRFGGDEFVVLAPGIRSRGQALTLARRLLGALSQPLDLGVGQVYPSGSIGVALRATRHRVPQDLLRDADAALYAAKRGGRNRAQVCDEQLSEEASRSLELVQDLREALSAQGLQVWYQPVWDVRRGCLASFEALARWWHPQRGQLPPELFVNLAERHQLAMPLLGVVLSQALAAQASSSLAPQVAVNTSAACLADPGFVRLVLGVLQQVELDPESLMLEITEHALMRNLAATARNMRALRSRGVRFSIDDFGTGYSSLAQLAQLPVDQLKIDRQFVQRLERDQRAAGICEAVVQLGARLGLEVVAEGVENPQQLTLLQQMGVDLVQGYLLARPGPLMCVPEVRPSEESRCGSL